MTLFLSREGGKRDWCHKSKVFKEFVDYWLPHGFFTQKVNEFLIFVIFDFLFVDVRHIRDNCRSQGLPLEEWKNLFKFFVL